MKFFYIIFAIALAFAHVKSIKDDADDSPLTVQVYYETLCPDSIAFIKTQFYPAYRSLLNYFTFELIPWGHASEEEVNNTRTFTCQHGPEECYGNKMHACAIELASQFDSFEFVFCSERSDAPADDINLKNCANTTGISWDDLQDCVSSGKGDELLSENGKKTKLVSPTFIPTIVINGTFNQEYQDESLLYFKTLLCSFIGNPIECRC